MQEPREQRRSTRHKCGLEVDLARSGAKFARVRSLDVSRHGLFVASAEPPNERFLVQLVIHLPDGPLPATAYVSRRVPTRGAGLELFALSASSKDRWDRFIGTLEGKGETKGLVLRAPQRATFLVRLRSQMRLHEFYEKNVITGGLYMATPVIKEAGAEIALVIIHPLTEQEYTLIGRVERVCRETPKGMEVQLLAMDLASKSAFREFVQSGLAPVSAPKPSPPVEPIEESGDLSIDIIVDEGLIEESEQFEWRDVSSDLVIDFQVADWEPEPPNHPVEISCDNCGAEVPGVMIGDADGALGLVAEHRVFECKECKTLRSALRMKPLDDRRQAARQIDPATAAKVSDLFAVAELGTVPTCADCGGNLKSTGLSKTFEKTAGQLVRGESARVEDMKCPKCGEELLRMRRKIK